MDASWRAWSSLASGVLAELIGEPGSRSGDPRGSRAAAAMGLGTLDGDGRPASRHGRSGPLESDPIGAWCMRCGAGIPDAMPAAWGCAACAGHRLVRSGTVRLSPYQAPGWSDALRRVKFARDGSAARMIGNALAAQWALASRSGLVPEPAALAAVVPVPMPAPRRMERGIDHARCIARACARALGVPLVPLLLQDPGAQQHFLGRRERSTRGSRRRMRARSAGLGTVQAMRHALWRVAHASALRACARRLREGCRHVVLVDDVLTTGVTVEECACTLGTAMRPAAAIWALVACVTEPECRYRTPSRE